MIRKLLARTAPLREQDFLLADDIRVGASPTCDIHLMQPGVSRVHARIYVDGPAVRVEDLGATNGTFLNGQRIQKDVLRHLDVLTLGRYVDLIYTAREAEAPPPVTDAVTAASLELVDAPERGSKVEIPKGELTIGRNPVCNVVLTEGAIGKVHARIGRTAQRVFIEDLKSTNGTFVNGKRITSAEVLYDGDTISFARVRTARVRISYNPAVKVDRDDNAAAPVDTETADQDWKTKFVWAPDELAAIEAARAEAVAMSSLARPAAPNERSKPAPAKGKAENAAAAAPPPQAPAAKATPAGQDAKPPKAPAVDVNAVPKQPVSAAPVVPAPPVPVQPSPGREEPRADKAPARAAPRAAPAPTPAAPLPNDQATMLSPRTGGSEADEMTRVLPVKPVSGVVFAGSSDRFPFGLGRFTVGRAMNADVRLQDLQVSRNHAIVTVTGESVMIENQEASNGTLVNGKDIARKERLHTGDVVKFGASEFTVEVLRS